MKIIITCTVVVIIVLIIGYLSYSGKKGSKTLQPDIQQDEKTRIQSALPETTTLTDEPPAAVTVLPEVEPSPTVQFRAAEPSEPEPVTKLADDLNTPTVLGASLAAGQTKAVSGGSVIPVSKQGMGFNSVNNVVDPIEDLPFTDDRFQTPKKDLPRTLPDISNFIKRTA